jgi:hypothetical protein
VPSLGWLGLGLSEAGGMPGADMAILLRNASGHGGFVLQDMWSTAFETPVLDAQQDKRLVSIEASWRRPPCVCSIFCRLQPPA